MHAEKCPVCNGSGKVATDKTSRFEKCHGCNGMGWIEIQDSQPVIPYTPYYPDPYIYPYRGTYGIPEWTDHIWVGGYSDYNTYLTGGSIYSAEKIGTTKED